MIDFIKLSLKSPRYAQELISNPYLIRAGTWTGYKKLSDVWDSFTFRGLEFRIHRSGRIEIKGSLHKYFNGGRHNHNNFTFKDLEGVIFELSELFGNDILTANVNNLEYGLNINPSFPAMKYVNSLIIYHSKGITSKSPITFRDSKGFDKGIRFTLRQYELKIYNKSQQYDDARANTLRVEFKTCKMEVIKELEIKFLADLLDRDKIAGLHEKLMDKFPGCISKEMLDKAILSHKERCELLEAENPSFWEALSRNRETYRIRTRLKQFEELQHKHATSQMKQEVRRLLNTKYNDLI